MGMSCAFHLARLHGHQRKQAAMYLDYLVQRQQVAKSMAKAAGSDVSRRIHERLASEYERHIEQVTDGSRARQCAPPTRSPG